MKKRRFRLSTLLWLALLAALLWWALRNAPVAEIWEVLRQLQLWQLGVLFVFNTVIFILIAMRWWLIVRAENPKVPLLPLLGYRLAAYGLSYFTPGPQVGGEPLQIIYLQKNFGLGFARATSAVILDKLLEFLANFIVLGAGLYAILRVGILTGTGFQANSSLAWLVPLLLWPLIHVILLYNGRYPVSWLLRAVQARFGDLRFLRLIMVSERMAASFCRRHLRSLLAAVGVSMLSWALMLLEYGLMLDFLSVRLDFWQTFAALTSALLSFLVPLPAGLGALEASQVFAINALGYPAAVGISLSLLIRARDIFLGGLGLVIAAIQSAKQ